MRHQAQTPCLTSNSCQCQGQTLQKVLCPLGRESTPMRPSLFPLFFSLKLIRLWRTTSPSPLTDCLVVSPAFACLQYSVVVVGKKSDGSFTPPSNTLTFVTPAAG